MPYSDIPSWCVKTAPIDWELELRAAFGLPLQWCGLELPSVCIGHLSLLELACCQFPVKPLDADAMDVARTAVILLKGKAAHAACQRHLELRSSGAVFELSDSSTWSELDREAGELLLKMPKDVFGLDSLAPLASWFNVAFSGYAMFQDSPPSRPSAWLFGLDTVASHLALMAKCSNMRPEEILWAMPMALGSHLAAQYAKANSHDAKICRPCDRGQVDRLRAYIKEAEDKGRLLYWQKMRPDAYELSDVQARAGGAELVKDFASLREKVAAMPPEERAARAAKILAEEGVE